jgi:hypothetical protein
VGLVVIDLGGVDQLAAQRIARRLVRQVTAARDGYAAREVLTHVMCRDHMTDSEDQALSATVQNTGIGRGTIPGQLMTDLMAAVDKSESAVAQHLNAISVGSHS